jgi:hypothetical protein
MTARRVAAATLPIPLWLLLAAPLAAQDGAEGRAPVDLTGQWVSVVTEDWAWRMRTPPPGDYASVPLNEEGRRVADLWDESQSGSCLAYGAAAMLRMPTRVRISWADDTTLQLESDNGMQLRWLHFEPEALDADIRMLQGHSRARWVTATSVTGSGATGGILTTDLDRAAWASLEVITTNMTPAWLRPNGVPYSDEAKLTQYFDRFDDGNDAWFTVTTIVEDPTYLTEPFVISSNFRRETEAGGWNPSPCRD